jgi:hypothetical protein
MSLFRRTKEFRRHDGMVIHAEYRRFTGTLLNLCVWDGLTWHQAPLRLWSKHDDLMTWLEIQAGSKVQFKG